MHHVDTVIVGGGVVGLALGRACAARYGSTVIFERHPRLGQELSSHNSEVMHAGLYYPPESLKARTCVAGRMWWQRYARERGIAYLRCGKLVVAVTHEEVETLERLKQQGQHNGVSGLVMVGRARLAYRWPSLRAQASLLSEETAVLDSHAALSALAADFEACGGVLALAHIVKSVDAARRTLHVVGPDGQAFDIRCERLVLANGLGLPGLLEHTSGLAPDYRCVYYWARGNYFAYHGAVPFDTLIYPVPQAGGLGIHLTLDLTGRARFGPDVEWISEPDWSVDRCRKPAFVRSIRRYWPELEEDRLQPAWAGIRPKLEPSGRFSDFRIDDATQHGVPGLWILAGIESPGLTAAPALAEEVIGRMDSE